MNIIVSAAPDESDASIIDAALADYNESTVGAADRLALSVIVRDDAGVICAGVNGQTAWGWLYVQRLWVGDSLRGQGMAGKMLSAAEDEARSRGCIGAYIDTFNPAALSAYQRQGYVEYGRMEQFVAGRDRIFLQKRWA
ncbi:GNAT family N-acetyltransferase [Martelella limonii]|uniref:GNAT family N-acetyltransferase n=1 Tax=Martelella limonii TaxID=1647649 RepID=UPI00157FC477|nr:GNAT family N-acetyltransferase [Martelella limonii]